MNPLEAILCIWAGGVLARLPLVMGVSGTSPWGTFFAYAFWIVWPFELLLWMMGVVKVTGTSDVREP